MGFAQDEAPYCPGETGNNPFERSKYALSHICECAQPPPLAGAESGHLA